MHIAKYALYGLLFCVFLMASTAQAAEVAQGECKSYDKEKHSIIIEEFDTNFDAENRYGKPTGIITEFDVADAKVGISPEPGDILRIAYVLEGDTRTALKVMNVSKQDIMKK